MTKLEELRAALDTAEATHYAACDALCAADAAFDAARADAYAADYAEDAAFDAYRTAHVAYQDELKKQKENSNGIREG